MFVWQRTVPRNPKLKQHCQQSDHVQKENAFPE
jgi:hypothetical protein